MKNRLVLACFIALMVSGCGTGDKVSIDSTKTENYTASPKRVLVMMRPISDMARNDFEKMSESKYTFEDKFSEGLKKCGVDSFFINPHEKNAYTASIIENFNPDATLYFHVISQQITTQQHLIGGYLVAGPVYQILSALHYKIVLKNAKGKDVWSAYADIALPTKSYGYLLANTLLKKMNDDGLISCLPEK